MFSYPQNASDLNRIDRFSLFAVTQCEATVSSAGFADVNVIGGWDHCSER